MDLLKIKPKIKNGFIQPNYTMIKFQFEVETCFIEHGISVLPTRKKYP